MSDMNLTELQQKELASAEEHEQAGLMQAMLQNAPSQALGAMAKSLATEIQERKEAEQDPMDTLSRQGKRGSSLQREEPSRGSGKGNPSKWPRGESKGGFGSGWSGSRDWKNKGQKDHKKEWNEDRQAAEEDPWYQEQGVQALSNRQLRELATNLSGAWNRETPGRSCCKKRRSKDSCIRPP